MMKYKQLWILPFLLFLASCSVFSPIKPVDENLYVISSQGSYCSKKSPRRIAVFVAPVRADGIYSSTQMVYSIQPYKIDYFVKNRWAIPPAQMLQTLIVQSLQNTHYFSVVDSTAIGQYDYLLSAHLMELKQVFNRHCSQVYLTMQVQLINAVTNRVVANRKFSVVQPAPYPTPYGGVIAANRAAAIVLSEIARFCVRKL